MKSTFETWGAWGSKLEDNDPTIQAWRLFLLKFCSPDFTVASLGEIGNLSEADEALQDCKGKLELSARAGADNCPAKEV